VSFLQGTTLPGCHNDCRV